MVRSGFQPHTQTPNKAGILNISIPSTMNRLPTISTESSIFKPHEKPIEKVGVSLLRGEATRGSVLGTDCAV